MANSPYIQGNILLQQQKQQEAILYDNPRIDGSVLSKSHKPSVRKESYIEDRANDSSVNQLQK